MNPRYKFFYHFYPVGQGLFSTGSIHWNNHTKSRFLWVYDCGTSSSENLVDKGIQKLDKFVADRKCIDLLTLSHFDRDHISGVVRLLKTFKIGTLLLPYMPFEQRLILSIEEGCGGMDDPLTNFLLNPVEFLLGQDGAEIERILFVLPSGNEGPAYPGDSLSPQEPGPDDEPKIQFEKGEPKNADDVGPLAKAAQAKNTLVDFLRPGSKITLSIYLWEFIPYNDDPQEVIPKAFTEQVAQERENLLSGPSKIAREDSLRNLKKAYDTCFGSGSEERNVISLFLYSGPIYSVWKGSWLMEGKSWFWEEIWTWYRWPYLDIVEWSLHEPMEPVRRRCSILYSGDGYLDTSDRLVRLIEYLDQRRVRRISVFQVMHHGAEANWHQGVGEAIAPIFSVFSSDPSRKKWKHPHASVLRDFWRFGAVQVDKKANFNVCGYVCE